MVDYNFKDKYDFSDLVEIMSILRAPGGCPWDAEQTHESIRSSFIEETYEAIEAINKKDKELLCEELGDVLLQVVFHAQIEKENGSFDIDSVTDGICKKLIERHPHVFSDVSADTTQKVLDNWDTIKRKSKNQKTQGSSMQKVPKELPALMRAQKIQGKAKKDGYDFESVDEVYKSLFDEIEELKQASKDGESKERITEEMGDVLFSAVNLARTLKIDSEEALTIANDKFIRRYLAAESIAEKQGLILKKLSATQLDELWKQAKKNVKSNED